MIEYKRFHFMNGIGDEGMASNLTRGVMPRVACGDYERIEVKQGAETADKQTGVGESSQPANVEVCCRYEKGEHECSQEVFSVGPDMIPWVGGDVFHLRACLRVLSCLAVPKTCS